MYIKVKKYKDYPDRSYLQVVESYREEGKVRNRTVLNLGRFDNNDALNRVNNLLKILLPYSSEIQSMDISKDIIPRASKQFGPLLIFQKLWKDLKLDEALNSSFSSIQTFYDLEKAIFNMVLNRLVAPSSKRKMTTFQDSTYGLSQFDLHQYYRAMDYLVSHKEQIENNIFNAVRGQIKGELKMAFFDTTSLVYYGDDKNEESELLDYGFSKARRGDLKQIIVGVLMSENGRPLGHETFSGNKNDVTCFREIVEKMVDKFNIKKIILVGDRGMISHKNIDLLEEMGIEYVLGFRMRTISKQDREEVFKKADLKQLRKSNLQYKEVEYKNKRLIFCYNEDRAKLDYEHRQRILDKLKEKIKSGKIETIIENKDYKRYLDIDGKAPKLSDKKIAKDELFDGVFVLTSNAPLTGPQVVEAYKGLWQIEQGFRQLKKELKVGPIYHYTDDRIRAHVMICFLALILRRELASRLKKSFKDSSYGDCLDELKQVHVVEMKAKEEEIHLLTEVKAKAKKLFKSIKLSIPDRVIYHSNPAVQLVVPRIGK